MNVPVLQAPKFLLPDEGESFNVADSTFTTKISGKETNGQWIMYEIAASVGYKPPLHSHPWDETFYILEGEIEIQVGSLKTMSKVGSVMFVPTNVPHTYKICSQIARFLVILAPASADVFYREYGEKSTAPPTLEDLQYFRNKYGICAYF